MWIPAAEVRVRMWSRLSVLTIRHPFSEAESAKPFRMIFIAKVRSMDAA